MAVAYRFIGRDRLKTSAPPAGSVIASRSDLHSWITAADEPVATFTVGLDGLLRCAPRRSEHVVCAGGLDVLAAGELGFDGDRLAWCSNQSTGYCPDVDCWSEFARASGFLVLPPTFTRSFVFRRCEACKELNVVRESWFVCVWCSADLPSEWNVGNRHPINFESRS